MWKQQPLIVKESDVTEQCEYCYKPVIKNKQTISRWDDKSGSHVAHFDCDRAVHGGCPQCGSKTGIKIPRGLPIYCEDCEWPDYDLGLPPDHPRNTDSEGE